MQLSECNPFLRTAEIQPAILEGSGPRMAYDHRLFYVLEREGTLLLDDRTVALAPDTLIFIPPAVGYYFRGKLRVVVLNFDMTRTCAARTIPICPPPAATFDPALCFDLTSADGLTAPVVLPGDAALRSAALELVQRFSGGGAQADAASSARLKLLLAELLSRLSPEAEPEHRLAARILGYIRLHAAEIESNTALGEVFGYHPVYLGEIFRRQYGQTLHAAIIGARIDLACRWLTQTDRSVEQIAFDTGFTSRSHFCTAFRRVMGSSPGQWRRSARAGDGGSGQQHLLF